MNPSLNFQFPQGLYSNNGTLFNYVSMLHQTNDVEWLQKNIIDTQNALKNTFLEGKA
jgi:hypothetical protein